MITRALRRQAEVDRGLKAGRTTDEIAEMRQLRREMADQAHHRDPGGLRGAQERLRTIQCLASAGLEEPLGRTPEEVPVEVGVHRHRSERPDGMNNGNPRPAGGRRAFRRRGDTLPLLRRRLHA